MNRLHRVKGGCWKVMVRNIFIVLVIAVSCIGCDRLTKDLARERLEPGRREALLGDVFLLQYEENHGGMLSLGAELSPHTRFWVFTVVVGTMLIGLTLYGCLNSNMPLFERVAVALITGGGMGNLIDRLVYDGAVIDFMNVGIGGLRTAIFNVADVLVLFGAMILILRVLRRVVRE